MKKEKPLASHEIEDAIDEIVAVIWDTDETKRIEFIHVIVGMHKDGKQIRMSFPKRER